MAQELYVALWHATYDSFKSCFPQYPPHILRKWLTSLEIWDIVKNTTHLVHANYIKVVDTQQFCEFESTCTAVEY